MPSKQQHLNKANRNESLSLKLIGQSNDWAVTICFYSAIHYIEAYLISKHKVNSGTHARRLNFLQTFSELKTICDDYSELSTQAHASRYLCKGFSDQSVKDYHNNELLRIKNYILSII